MCLAVRHYKNILAVRNHALFFVAISMAADVSGEKFAVIGCSLLLIRMIQEYLSCLARLPEPSLLHKLADLLSLFNSRCCQLVLGGGATTTLGLRSITIKHLALTGMEITSFVFFVVFS